MSQGYGADTWCTDRLAPGKLARGPVVVAQALFGRLITPRGTLRGGAEESAYGFDIAGYVGAVGTEIALQALPAQVRGELLKDDRVSQVVVTANESEETEGEIDIVLQIDVTLFDGSTQFTLTVGVSGAAAVLLGSTA